MFMRGVFLTIAIIAVIVGLSFLGIYFWAAPAAGAYIAEMISDQLGVGTEIADVKFRWGGPGITLLGMKIENPEGFGDGYLAVITKLTIDVRSYFRPKDIMKVSIDIERLVVVEKKDGSLNIDALELEKKQQRSFPDLPELVLTVDKVIHKVYSDGEKPAVKVYEPDIHEQHYEGIPNIRGVARVIKLKAIGNLSMKGLAIYGAGTVAGLSGVGLIPVAVGGAFMMSDSGDGATFKVSYDEVFSAAEAAVNALGTLHSKEKGSGRITGEVQGANVSIDIQGDGENKTHVKVSTRKYFIMPKEQLSAGIIYEISARLRPGE